MAFAIRKFLPHQFKLARDWSIKEHWNSGIHDYIAHQTFADSFWMGTLNNQPIACMSGGQYDEKFAHPALYIVKPEFRHKGYGIKVFNHAISSITSKNIGFYGVLQQQANYKKSGFTSYDRSVSHTTKGTGKPFLSPYLRDCKDVDFEKLLDYDTCHFPTSRRKFLEKWINLPESKSVVFMSEGQIYGFGVIRPSSDGYRIAPLFAQNYQIALQIFKNLIGSVSPDSQVFIDIPDVNQNASKLAKQFSMKPGFTCVRMYNNGMPKIPIQKSIYGVTSLQFG